VKKIAPETVVFSEFYSADWLVHSKELQRRALTHNPSEYPLIIQIFGKDPTMFAEAAKIIEWYWITGIDINMGCPAKKVVKSGHGSSLMINRDTAFKIVEEMAKAVKIPISVKTRLGWENHSLLTEFVLGLEWAGASLISVHGRTYKQAFTGKADLTGIYELKQHVNIPVICNGDVLSYEDGIQKMIHPEGLKNLDGFMIGRASFGNPWCFLPWNYEPTLGEILDVMKEHGDLLWSCKARKGMMEARKHLVQYLHGFPGVKEYRSALVHVESPDDIYRILDTIRWEHSPLMNQKISSYNTDTQMMTWDCGID
jgi:tRNA-dihydrouridine synthase B